MIYLDNAATTQIHPEVVKEMTPYLTDKFGNAGSLYNLGRESAEAIVKARSQVADLIGAKAEDIVFTSGGTEANNLVFKGLEDYLREHGKTHIITTIIEHDSVIHATEMLIKRHFDITYLPVNMYCKVSVESVKDAIREDTGLVSVMYVNNETGSVQPIKEIAQICKEKNILFHTDCVQAIGFQDVNVEEISCDFLSMSSHKLHGCKGMGALYIRDKKYITPLISGGNNQEFGLRGGTENVAGIVGFGKACEIAKNSFKENTCKILAMKRLFRHELLMLLNKNIIKGVYENRGGAGGKIISLRIDGVDAQTLILALSNRGICISSGSACHSLESKPSRVLTAMGYSADEARNSIRISFSEFTSSEDVKVAAVELVNCIELIRSVTIE